MKDTILYAVVPCYNEEAVLPETARQLWELFDRMIAGGIISPESRIVFVDDGSRDQTWPIIHSLARDNTRIYGLKLARNAGHQNALLAGLMTIRDRCDCALSVDADLQDDIGAIPEFVRQFEQGKDVVYGVRSDRKSDSAFKRCTAQGFYRLMNLLGADVIPNHADYRLMSRRALDALSQFPEVNLFLRGMVRLVGFSEGTVYYSRSPRFAGESKYPLKRMLSFALDGVTSFTVKPIRMVWAMGMIVAVIAILAAIYTLAARFRGVATSGWASLMISIWFLGGVQLISVGLIGEYIGKIYKEVKQRPRYIIEEFLE